MLTIFDRVWLEKLGKYLDKPIVEYDFDLKCFTFNRDRLDKAVNDMLYDEARKAGSDVSGQ